MLNEALKKKMLAVEQVMGLVDHMYHTVGLVDHMYRIVE